MILNYAYSDSNKPRGVFRDDIGELLDISIRFHDEISLKKLRMTSRHFIVFLFF